jgi:hypothetical protein
MVSGMFLWSCERSPTEPDVSLFNLCVTEIYYNPPDTGTISGDSLEFVELQNTGSTVLDVGTLEFTDGIDYVFPTDAEIPAGGFYIVASSKKCFKRFYGIEPDGEFKGTLKNSTETVILTDAFTVNDIITITYADSGDWPKEPDGDGYSLVLKDNRSTDNISDPDNWRRSAMRYGSPGEKDILEPPDSSLNDLRITEIHYHPADRDSSDGDSLEFIELKNVGEIPMPLDGIAFTDGISYTFATGTTLDPDELIVLASNKNWFQDRYNETPFDVYDGQLSNSGEKITVGYVPSGTKVLHIEYMDSSPWPKEADGDGYSLVPYSTVPGRDQNNAAYWRPSSEINGSPGRDDPDIVVINEILPNPDATSDEAIEIFNPGKNAVDISGWYLTDDMDIPVKYIIPPGTVLGPDEYYVFTENEFGNDATAAIPFSFCSHGEEVYLFADSGGCENGFCYGFSYGEIEEGFSIGRYVTSYGKERFTVQRAVSLGERNDGPLVGPVIISEIMFHSPDGRNDYIEITNIDLQEIRLYDPDNPANAWKIDNIDFTFPEATTIRSGESIMVASDLVSTDALKNSYDIDDDVQVFHFSGTLPDDGFKISLLKPEEPCIKDSTESMVPTVPYMEFDKISYKTNAPWPTDAAGNGNTLHRVNDTSFSNDPESWTADSPDPGTFQ